MNDCEDIQDEGETVDLVVWEEYVRWAESVSQAIQAGWEIWVGQYHPKIEDGSLTDSQRRMVLTD